MAKLILTHADSIRKIQAIKNVRASTGCGLKEAKDFVDNFIDTRNPQVIMDDLTVADAETRLRSLCSEGYAEGRIEVSPQEREAELSLALRLADAIALARDTHLTPSEIINRLI
jgi:hypothetical protein